MGVLPLRTFLLKVYPLGRAIAKDRAPDLAWKSPATSAAFLRALRVHHWSKNLLLFLPMLLAHRIADASLWPRLAAAFLSFSICASGVYLLNDVLDVEADRQHPIKRDRPFASGALPLWIGLALFPVLAAIALAIALYAGRPFLAYLVLYGLATAAYSAYLKHIPNVDVIVLAGLYTVRIMAGGVAAEVPISPWLLGFSVFLFLSLALAKRCAELVRAGGAARGYLPIDLEQLFLFGTVSGYLSVLVFALYINSPDVGTLYRSPRLLWLVCPLLILWINRVWLLTRRGRMAEDPVVFALRDPVSYALGFLACAVVMCSI